MKHLNSFLVEGITMSDPLVVRNEGEEPTACRISIESNGNMSIMVEVVNQNMIKYMEQLAKAGRGLRAVGSIRCRDGYHYMLAEHVEYKPQFRADQEQNKEERSAF